MGSRKVCGGVLAPPPPGLPQIRRFNCRIDMIHFHRRIWGRCPKDGGGLQRQPHPQPLILSALEDLWRDGHIVHGQAEVDR